MRIVLAGMIVAGMLPLLSAWRANRATSLAHAILWAIAAWLSWGGALLVGDMEATGMEAGRYCALCLTGCAGIAVLGARRPHVGAWNFVVLGLFAVMVLPLVETLFLGTSPVDDWLRIFFLSATISIGLLNYSLTRFAPAAFLLAASCAGEIALLYAPGWFPEPKAALGMHALLLATPWIAWLCLERRGGQHQECDRLWLDFRDRWGVLWSQRVREQFNHAARSAGWPVKLSWRGLTRQAGERAPTLREQEKIAQTLRAVLQRFLSIEASD